MIKQAGTDGVIREKKYELARLITDLHFRASPDLMQLYGVAGKVRYYEEVLFHLEYLAQSIRSETPQIFVSYVVWTRSLLQSRKIEAGHLIDNLRFIQRSCQQLMEEDQAKEAETYLKVATESLQQRDEQQQGSEHPGSGFSEDNPLMSFAKKYLSLLLEGEKESAFTVIRELRASGSTIQEIYEYIFEAALREIGRLWQMNVITVAHEHYCSAATQFIMTRLSPYVVNGEKKERKLVSCTISGELHQIGIRMVSDFFEMNGWDTYYMGADMPENELINALYEQNADILAISVTIPANLYKAENLISKIRSDQAFESLKIMAGGYTFGQMPDLWKQIGANASAINAREAVLVAKSLTS